MSMPTSTSRQRMVRVETTARGTTVLFSLSTLPTSPTRDSWLLLLPSERGTKECQKEQKHKKEFQRSRQSNDLYDFSLRSGYGSETPWLLIISQNRPVSGVLNNFCSTLNLPKTNVVLQNIFNGFFIAPIGDSTDIIITWWSWHVNLLKTKRKCNRNCTTVAVNYRKMKQLQNNIHLSFLCRFLRGTGFVSNSTSIANC